MRTGDEDNDGVEENYTMKNSFEYTIVGSKDTLVISDIEPNATTIQSASNPTTVELKVKTLGGNEDGLSYCKYKNLNSNKDYAFFETDFPLIKKNYLHFQTLKLYEGEYNYSIYCYDDALNYDIKNISFKVEVDNDPPEIARAYYEAGKMKLITTEKADCVYSSVGKSYSFEDDGLQIQTNDKIHHSLEWNTEYDLFIKCKDEFGNKPGYGDATIIVRAYNEFNSGN
jgi:hypothetical protein